MMKKILFALFSILLTAAPASAKSVVFVLNDSTKVYYLIGNGPVIKINATGFTVGQDSYEFSAFDRFYISNDDKDPSGIDLLRSSDLRFENGNIVVDSTQPVALYTADGKAVAVRQQQAAGQTAIDTTALPRGTYILRIGNTSTKFTKR